MACLSTMVYPNTEKLSRARKNKKVYWNDLWVSKAWGINSHARSWHRVENIFGESCLKHFCFPMHEWPFLLFWATYFTSMSYQKYNQKWFLTPSQKHFTFVPSSAEFHFFLHGPWILYSYDFKPLSSVAWIKQTQSSPECRQHRDSMKLLLPTLFSAGATCQAKYRIWPIVLHDLN